MPRGSNLATLYTTREETAQTWELIPFIVAVGSDTTIPLSTQVADNPDDHPVPALLVYPESYCSPVFP
jgi:hypothetical protein